MIHGGICDSKVNIDFSVNLNPLGTPKEVLKGISEGVKRLGEYPEYSQSSLREALGRLEGISADEVVAGNGASELIMAVVRAVNPKKAVLIEPGFYGYRHALNSLPECSIEEVRIMPENDFKIDIDKVNISLIDADILFISQPWNPTGYCIEENELERILERAAQEGCAVVLDQSFIMLSNDYNSVYINNIKGMLERYDNVYIIRSFTKLMAIPGVRIGYIMSTKSNIHKICGQLGEWNVSQVADYAARECVRTIIETDFLKATQNYVNQEREYLTKSLKRMGIRVYDSSTVYIMFGEKQELFDKLLDRGILIRDCKSFKGLENGYYRIAVKDHESNVKLIEAINEIRTCKTRRNREAQL